MQKIKNKKVKVTGHAGKIRVRFDVFQKNPLRFQKKVVYLQKHLKGDKIMAIQVSHFNPAQQAVLNVVSCLHSEQDLADLKRTLVKFMNERLQREMDKLWSSGKWSKEKLQAMESEHLRTSYK